ncbi:MAG: DUF4173 domain-containing protein [Clostridiales bacterium]|nr:DUF4173 domain-containing protein [Clostridiales bacterium]
MSEKTADSMPVLQQWKLIAFAIVSAILSIYLTMMVMPGVGITLFVLLEAVLLYFTLPKNVSKRIMLLLIFPTLISCWAFITHNDTFAFFNVIAIVLMFSCVALLLRNPNIYNERQFIAAVISYAFIPFNYFGEFFNMLASDRAKKTKYVSRIICAIIIAIPILILLLAILSSADPVFMQILKSFWRFMINLISFETVLKIIVGAIIGLYFFGLAYSVCVPEAPKVVVSRPSNISWDAFITYIITILVLMVYTFFVIVQVKYLFLAPGVLPNGITHAEYARQGFFQLLWLSIVNILFIYLIMNFTQPKNAILKKIKPWMLMYSCLVTLMLLVSSAYRMQLYIQSDGLTRMRLLVVTFLAFEVFGLIATAIYIYKPKMNIVLYYAIVTLAFYVSINCMPVDSIVARNQIARFIKGDSQGVRYVTTLSRDANRYLEQIKDDARLPEEDKKLIERKLSRPAEWIQWQQWKIGSEKAIMLK